MDERLKKRILAFYVAGVVNLALGFYVLIAGPGFLPQNTVFWLALFFLGFAAVDFWFPRVLKKRWADMMAKHLEQQRAKAEGGTQKAEG
jgi:uncharacterized membrane protein